MTPHRTKSCPSAADSARPALGMRPTGRRYLDMTLLAEMDDEEGGEPGKKVTCLVSTV